MAASRRFVLSRYVGFTEVARATESEREAERRLLLWVLHDGPGLTGTHAAALAARAHLEPPVALAQVAPGTKGQIGIWTATQYLQKVIDDTHAALGKDHEILLHPTHLGSGFGRKAKPPPWRLRGCRRQLES